MAAKKRGEYLKLDDSQKGQLRRFMLEAELQSTGSKKRNALFLDSAKQFLGADAVKHVTGDMMQKWHKEWASQPEYEKEISERRRLNSQIAGGRNTAKLQEQEKWVQGMGKWVWAWEGWWEEEISRDEISDRGRESGGRDARTVSSGRNE